MHKSDLIRQVAAESGVSQAVAARVINSALDAIVKEVSEGKRVVLTGFGAFELRHRRERHGVDPRTAKDIVVPESFTPGFTASGTFRSRARPTG